MFAGTGGRGVRGRVGNRVRRAVAAAAVCALLLWAGAGTGGALSYYRPGPSGRVGVSRPTIAQQFVLKPGESLAGARMWIDGQEVRPVWDGASSTLWYTPPEPLAPGDHRVRIMVMVNPESPGLTYDPVETEFVLTVAAGAAPELPRPGAEQQRALEWVNGLRRAAGLRELAPSASLQAAASGHAAYLALHPERRDESAHFQREGDRLYFGATTAGRARYFGYAGAASEVVNFAQRAEDAIDSWMETLYHRIPLIHPGMTEAGYGLDAGGQGPVNVMLTGPLNETPGVALWPYPGQTGVPTGWDGAEVPDPFRLYPGAARPVGYPISATFGGQVAALLLRTGTLTGPEGDVPVMLFHPGNDSLLQDTVALIPRAPLTPGATYSVRLAGEVDLGAGLRPFDHRWTFTTASEHRPRLKRRVTTGLSDGTVQAIRLEGEGFGQGLRLFLGGLPAEDVQVQSATTLTFAPPSGYRGEAADLLLVTPEGREVVWPAFFRGTEPLRFPDQGRPFAERQVLVHGQALASPALVHRSGAILLPDEVLEALGARSNAVPGTGRTYWSFQGRTGDYTPGRTAATAGGRGFALSLPVRQERGRTFVEAAFVRELTGMPVTVSPTRVEVGLQDVGSHWARPAILRLLEAGLVSGGADGRFRPDEPVTRAAFVKLLAGARRLAPAPGLSGGFADTLRHWVSAQGYIGAAVRAGIVNREDYPDGRFEPDRPITREEMAVMVTRALGLEERALAFAGERDGIGGRIFSDAEAWSRPGHIAVAVEEGLLSGYREEDGAYTFRPGGQATRAEACALIVRLLDR